MGGTLENPTYEDVCTDKTGHAEVIEVTYDPQVIDYHTLLDVFFQNHDPTQLNRQGEDVGTQYRSVIFYHSDEQQQAAEAFKKRLEAGEYQKPLCTQIVPVQTFWLAEAYHQQYLKKQGLKSCPID